MTSRAWRLCVVVALAAAATVCCAASPPAAARSATAASSTSSNVNTLAGRSILRSKHSKKKQDESGGWNFVPPPIEAHNKQPQLQPKHVAATASLCSSPLPLNFTTTTTTTAASKAATVVDYSRGWFCDTYDASWRRTLSGPLTKLKVWQRGGQQVKWEALFPDGRRALIKPVSDWKKRMIYEVVSHHLDRLLGLYRAPYVVLRPVERSALLDVIDPSRAYGHFKEFFETQHGSSFKEKAEKDMCTYVDDEGR
jgi:hypothetical protein